MFGKLMKYDLRNCYRRFGAFWIAILALAVLNGVLMNGFFEKLRQSTGLIGVLVSVIPPMALFVLLAATGVLAFIFVCERFYNGLLGDEGYLAFTLPATVTEHIAAKTVSAILLWIVSFVVAIVSGLVFLFIYDPAETIQALRMLPEALRMVRLPFSVPLLAAEMIILVLISAAKEILRIYAAIAIGHLIAGRRKIAAILSYFGLGIIESILATFVMGAGQTMGVFSALESSDIHVQYVNDVWEISNLGPIVGLIGALIVGTAVLSAVYFLITKVILNRNLNLE